MTYSVGFVLADLGQLFSTGLPTLSGTLNLPAAGPPTTATSPSPPLTLTFATPPNPPASPGTLLVTDPAGPGDFLRSGTVSAWPAEPVFINAGTGVLPITYAALTGGIAVPLNIDLPAGAIVGIGFATGFMFTPFKFTITNLILFRSPTTGAIRARFRGIISFFTLFIPRRTDFSGTVDITLAPSGDAADIGNVISATTSNLSINTGFITPLSTPILALLSPAFSGALSRPLTARVRAAMAPTIASVRAAAASAAGLNLFSSAAAVNVRRLTLTGTGVIVQAVLSELQGGFRMMGAALVAAAPLSDGRLETWAVTPDGRLFSTWKTATDSRSDWAPWFDFLADRGALPAALRQAAMVQLPDGRLESWVVTANGGIFSTWKVDTGSNADWAPWFDVIADRGALPAAAEQVAMGRLSDGRLESWVVTANGGLFTTWKTNTDPNADWAPWADFLAEVGPVPGGVLQVMAASLPDGRIELWAVTRNGGLFTTWKVNTDPNSNWAPWTDFLAEVGALPGGALQVTAAALPDGRLELWAVTTGGGVFSTWKVDAGANANWTPWIDFLAEVGPLPAPVRQVALAPLSDGRLAGWAVTDTSGVFLTSKMTTDPNANWADWANFLVEV
jgi:hypothetical protein